MMYITLINRANHYNHKFAKVGQGGAWCGMVGHSGARWGVVGSGGPRQGKVGQGRVCRGGDDPDDAGRCWMMRCTLLGVVGCCWALLDDAG